MPERKIQKIGGSLVVAIPAFYANELGMVEGKYVKFERNGEGLMLTPVIEVAAGGDAVDGNGKNAG